eukprot:TRINITY_DN33814_c0_g1_i1.p2 TRINITY_DN33814_c0_g1~~TRINITY_DN33814_c0_g1_i1.p2  ORF type:complete len:111 (-),score=12.50 TRINITY_DN33814_c0_g1_i1:97-396(-)
MVVAPGQNKPAGNDWLDNYFRMLCNVRPNHRQTLLSSPVAQCPRRYRCIYHHYQLVEFEQELLLGCLRSSKLHTHIRLESQPFQSHKTLHLPGRDAMPS